MAWFWTIPPRSSLEAFKNSVCNGLAFSSWSVEETIASTLLTPVCTRGEHEKHSHCCDRESRLLVTLRRGQRTWTLLNHNWRSTEPAPSRESLPICLIRGAYEICVL